MSSARPVRPAGWELVRTGLKETAGDLAVGALVGGFAMTLGAPVTGGLATAATGVAVIRSGARAVQMIGGWCQGFALQAHTGFCNLMASEALKTGFASGMATLLHGVGVTKKLTHDHGLSDVQAAGVVTASAIVATNVASKLVQRMGMWASAPKDPSASAQPLMDHASDAHITVSGPRS